MACSKKFLILQLDCNTFLDTIYLVSVIKPFHATGLFIYLLKTPENFFSRGMERYRYHVTGKLKNSTGTASFKNSVWLLSGNYLSTLGCSLFYDAMLNRSTNNRA